MTRLATIKRLARRIQPGKPIGVTTWRNCTVDHTVASGSADGVTAVFIKRGGDVIAAPYLDSYDATAAVNGDMVRVSFTDGSPLIHGQVVGLPNLS